MSESRMSDLELVLIVVSGVGCLIGMASAGDRDKLSNISGLVAEMAKRLLNKEGQ